MIETLLTGLYLLGAGVITLLFMVITLLVMEQLFTFDSNNWSTRTKHVFIVTVILSVSYTVGLAAQLIS